VSGLFVRTGRWGSREEGVCLSWLELEMMQVFFKMNAERSQIGVLNRALFHKTICCWRGTLENAIRDHGESQDIRFSVGKACIMRARTFEASCKLTMKTRE